ncbi:sensor histidine kinase [Lysobacter sp. TY2-98]|uniref:sensor histidine kinase n=1 Tax=Lysobacter sp. TY2-98 TaxID=2290922 RepID=UPI000E204AA5|nr:HAMP domain-containing sensor histidine kinase [Lysobacter sp. TY2-98]AXK73193.1 sensor histidine kinase [Lysobacter sp. TY2-98]
MQLSRFIHSQMDAILADWEEFARRNAPDDSHMTDLALRDHARDILYAVALDLESPQSQDEQFAKSQGDSDDVRGPRTAAAIHGALRQDSDFSLLQLSAEFRALRATVLRQWLPTVGHVDDHTLDEMVRFNEAIDQALAQSIVAYSERADAARDLFLAVLGHDLRSPLATVAMIGQLLTGTGVSPEQTRQLGQRASRSARFMSHMVDDLLGYTRVQMGPGIPTSSVECDLADVVRAALADAGATYPNAHFDMQLDGDLRSHADPVRLQQLLTNLLVNAAQHGASGFPVRLEAEGQAGDLVVRVINQGRPLPTEDIERIFKPLVQLPAAETRTTSLGLGLYIAREIAMAHGGTLRVTSDSEHGTIFELRMPRRASAAAPLTSATTDHPAITSAPSMR